MENIEIYKLIIPSAIALFVLGVTNIVLIYKIKLDTRASIKKELLIARIKFDKERLEKFYDPIYTTLKTNTEMFNSFGYKSFPDNEILRNEAYEVWKLIAQNVIIPNNTNISNIIKSYSHLITPTDDLGIYIAFLKHAESYKHFILFPNALHKNFPYPDNIISNIESHRNMLLNETNSQEIKLLA